MSDTNAAIELGEPRPADAVADAEDVEAEQANDQDSLLTGLRRTNHRLKAVLAATMVVMVVVGASVGVYYGFFHSESGLSVDTNTETQFEASYVHDGQTVRLRLRNTPADEPSVLAWSFLFGESGTSRRVDYDMDMRTEGAYRVVLDGHGVVLTVAEKKALFHLKDELAAHLAREHDMQIALNVGMLERTSSYLYQAPRDYAINRQEFVIHANTQAPEDGAAAGDAPEADGAAGPGLKRSAAVQAWEQDDGVTCLYWGGVYQMRFDEGTSGQGWGWWHVVGTDSQCTGRCGAGCSWWDRKAYRDCADHDLCVTFFGGSVLFDNPDCGDEFAHAADDYIASFFPC